MKRAVFYLLTTVALLILGCSGEHDSSTQPNDADISREEKAGLDVLSDYAAHLIGMEGFPNLDPFQPSAEDGIFRERLREACPNAMDADVLIGGNAYVIGPRPKEVIAGDRTNWVNPKIVRELNTSGVTEHYEVEFDYTTLDGDSGSVPATLLAVDRTIKGYKVRLVLSRERTQVAPSDGDKPSN